MVQPVDPKQVYYEARDARRAAESARNAYMSQFANSNVFDQSKADGYNDALKQTQSAEFTGECNFSNSLAKDFHDSIREMMYPGLNFS